MPSPAATRSQQELLIGAAVTAIAIAGAIIFHHWTLALAPLVWVGIAYLSSVPLPKRFAALAAATVLLPRYPLRFGLSLDDLIPCAAAIAGIFYLARENFPRPPRLVRWAFGVWLVAAVLSAAINGHSPSGVVKLAAPGVGRPVFWLIFAWTASVLTQRFGIRALLAPIAAVMIVESLLSIAAYSRCQEIHLGAISKPDNREVWEARRGLGVEQGAGTNVGVERIRCRATGTLGQSSNFLAAALVTTLPLVVGLAIAERGRRRAIYAVGAVVVFAALFLTFTRASLIAVLIAIAVTMLFAAPKRLLPLLAGAAVVLVLAGLAIPQIRNRISDPKQDRCALWVSGIRIFKDNWPFGVGFGRYLEVQHSSTRYTHTYCGEPTTTSHNGFIAIAAEGGVIQLGAVLVLAGAILTAGWKSASRARGTPDAALMAGAFGGACGFLAQNMTNTLLLVPAVATYFWLLGGALIGAAAQPGPKVAPSPAKVGAE